MTTSAEGRTLPRLHLVTDERVLRDGDFLSAARRALAEGGPRVALHLRGRASTGRELWEQARLLVAKARATGAWLVVNDRLDVARGCGADAVQLGQTSFPVFDARRLLEPKTAIGVSVHTPAEAANAVRNGADFLLAGTLFESETHPGQRPAGLVWLREAASLGVPVIGIGGITPDRIRPVLDAGASGVAAIRGIWNAPDPIDALGQYLQHLE